MAIPITRPFFGEREMLAVQEPLKNGWVVQGPHVEKFENMFSTFSGATFSVATSNCTSALHIAVAALGLGAGDEVVVPAFTWVSTANVVEYMAARPVFCDIDLETFNINAEKVEELTSPRTVGIIPVHLFGLCADMDRIGEIAQKRSLWVIEDGACALGARFHERHAGTFGEMGCFSFHPRKSITTGEGGMITTDREDLQTLARSLRDHGASRSDLERHEGAASFLLSEYNLLGYNYRMTDIQGALGCSQMERAEWILGERIRRARRYDEMLAGVDWLKTPAVPDGYVHGYQSYVCLFCPEEPTPANIEALHRQRNRLMIDMEGKGIATRQGTHAPVIVGYYARKYGLRPEAYPNAYMADRISLTLPLYVQMTDEEQETVVRELEKSFEQTR